MPKNVSALMKNRVNNKKKVKLNPITGHEGPQGE
jgi:hypothetical protein